MEQLLEQQVVQLTQQLYLSQPQVITQRLFHNQQLKSLHPALLSAEEAMLRMPELVNYSAVDSLKSAI